MTCHMQIVDKFKDKLFEAYLSSHNKMSNSSNLHVADVVGGADHLKKDILETVRQVNAIPW